MSAIIINDPIYGFTSVPRGLLAALIDRPEFQRLDRIRQLGTSSFVYPSAKHSRKQHSLGAFHLMQEALAVLAQKGTFLFDSEIEAVEAAIFLHDIGHGPFSHVLEQVFTPGINHEAISLRIMERIDQDLRGDLSLAIKIYRNDYPKRFLHELLSSQLDMDRMDYVNRDAFYCGIQEGSIGAARIIKMLNLHDDRLVVEQKGLHTVENYLMARRLMYWQVYLHKTVVAAEEVLRSALRRAQELMRQGTTLFASPALTYFLSHEEEHPNVLLSDEALHQYLRLSDDDILCALSVWRDHSDKILSTLAAAFIERKLFKVEVLEGDVTDIEIIQHLARLRADTAELLHLSEAEAAYFVTARRISKEMYSTSAEGIGILQIDGSVADVGTVSNIVRADTPRELKDHKVFIFRHRILG